MAMFRQCCCCCDLRTGVILIGVFGLIFSGYNIVNEVLVLKKLPEAEKLLKEHEGDFAKKYGFSKDLFDSVETMAKVSCALSGVNILAAIFLLVPTCFSDPAQGRKVRGCLLVWVTWSVIQVLWNIGYGAWIFAKYTNIIVAVAIVAGLGISLPLIIYFILVVIAFFQELGEGAVPYSVTSPPSNIPYGKMEDMPPAYAYNRPV